MFVSQVIFQSEQGKEEVLPGIIKKKKESAEAAAGIVSAECWKQEGDTPGYALVTKWESKEQFRSWMADSHKRKPGEEKPEQKNKGSLKKIGYQFEDVTADL